MAEYEKEISHIDNFRASFCSSYDNFLLGRLGSHYSYDCSCLYILKVWSTFFLLIFWGKPKKEIKKSDTKKPPKKMKYLYWSKDDSGRPFAKAIGEQEQKNEKNPGKTKQ